MPYCTLITKSWSECHLYLGKYELRREKKPTRLDTNRPPQHRQSVLYKLIILMDGFGFYAFFNSISSSDGLTRMKGYVQWMRRIRFEWDSNSGPQDQ